MNEKDRVLQCLSLYCIVVLVPYENFFEVNPAEYPGVVSSMEANNFGAQYMPITLDELETLSEGDETLRGLHDDLLAYACRYATDVWGMHEFLTKGALDDVRAKEFAEKDDARTRLHNALIDSFRIFSRAFAREGRDNTWLEELERGGRAAYGRFALLLAYHLYCREIEHSSNQGENHDDRL